MKDGWNPSDVPVLALAFMGDAIWHVYVRNHVLTCGIRRPDLLHKAAVRYAKAGAQAKAILTLMDELTEQEQAVVRRGRNAKSSRMAKNADVVEYRYSTGFEALIGFLYGAGETDRLDEVCMRALTLLDDESGANYATDK